MNRVERVRDGHGTDVTIDHGSRTIRGRVALPKPGPCPHSHVVHVRDDVSRRESCIGAADHFGDHADAAGRSWPAKRREEKRRRRR